MSVINTKARLQCADCGDIGPSEQMDMVGGMPFCKVCNPALPVMEDIVYEQD